LMVWSWANSNAVKTFVIDPISQFWWIGPRCCGLLGWPMMIAGSMCLALASLTLADSKSVTLPMITKD
jgi:hypothetical protein